MDEGYARWAARWRVPLGWALGAAFLVFSQPTVTGLVAGGAVALLGLALRAIAAGYLDKNERLAASGPYAYSRNPLYLGSFIMGVGFVLAGGSWALGVAFIIFFPLVYWPVMRREEDSLRRKFGEAYERYAKTVPLFLIGRQTANPSSGHFRWEKYLKNREYEAAAGYLGGIFFLFLKLELR